MTTTVVVKALHGWAVRVEFIDPRINKIMGSSVVKEGTEETFHVYDTRDIRVHEIQKNEMERMALAEKFNNEEI